MPCSHCGLPVPPGLVEADEELQFCCRGCRTVYAVIHGCGLERFYRLRDAAPGTAQPARTTQRAYAEFDDDVFRTLYYRQMADGATATEFYLEGVHCAACVWLVEKLPQVLPGVIEARLDMRRAIVEIRWDPGAVKLSRIAATLDSLGYPPHPAKDIRARQMRREENHRFLIRLGVAAACMGNVMTLAFALYGGVFTGIEAQYCATLPLGQHGLRPDLARLAGKSFLPRRWAAIRTRTAHLDLPIAIGLAAGGIAGTVNAVLGRGEIYFDSLTMLVLLLLVGRWLQRRQQCWANDALELLFSLTPTSARRLENGHGRRSAHRGRAARRPGRSAGGRFDPGRWPRRGRRVGGQSGLAYGRVAAGGRLARQPGRCRHAQRLDAAGGGGARRWAKRPAWAA